MGHSLRWGSVRTPLSGRFFVARLPWLAGAEKALSSTLHPFDTLGDTVANNKKVGPAMELLFHAILIDTKRFQLRQPADKLARLRLLVAGWQSRKSASWSLSSATYPTQQSLFSTAYGHCLGFCHQRRDLSSSTI